MIEMIFNEIDLYFLLIFTNYRYGQVLNSHLSVSQQASIASRAVFTVP